MTTEPTPVVVTVDPSRSIRDRLRESIAATVVRKPIRIDVPERPGFVVEYALLDPLRDDTKMEAWAEQTGADKDGASKDSFIRASMLLLIDCCRGIYVDGEQWLDDTGAAVTFSHKDFRETVNEERWSEAVVAFYGSKADAAECSNIIVMRSGMVPRSKEQPSPTKG